MTAVYGLTRTVRSKVLKGKAYVESTMPLVQETYARKLPVCTVVDYSVAN